MFAACLYLQPIPLSDSEGVVAKAEDMARLRLVWRLSKGPERLWHVQKLTCERGISSERARRGSRQPKTQSTDLTTHITINPWIRRDISLKIYEKNKPSNNSETHEKIRGTSDASQHPK